MVSGGDVYVDNIVLTEITDSIYLVQPTVPECPQGEIGCAAYRDRAGKQHFLKSFTRLCSEQVVGCEAMIDTQNSSSPYATTIKNVATPADRMVTMVYNPGVACSATAKGCSAYGRPNYSLDRKLADYTNVYLVNDPDRYNGDLCYQEEVFCQAYQTANGGAAFFKDPLTSTCDYRGGSWLITGTSYACPTVTPPIAGRPIGPSCSTVCKGQCNNDASRACVTNNDCLVGGTCQGGGDRIGRGCLGDSDCPNSVMGCHGNPATIGKVIKGASIVVGQCQSDSDCNGGNKCIYLAGMCPAEQNGCTEYRDPGDPTGCRVECPLVKLGGEPQYSDAGCVPTVCAAGKYAGKSCQTSDDCPGSSCSGQGLPGCRSYYYKAQSLEDKASECGGQVNLDIGCRPFYNTANPTLNFRGE